jgi:hypothetical protein
MASEPIALLQGEILPSSRLDGVAIALGSLLLVAFMAIHPTIESRRATDFIAEVARKAVVNGVVHGSLIAVLGVLVCGFTGLASRLGLSLFVVRAGLVSYAMGAFAMIAAALISGFMVPEVVSRYQGRPVEELEMMRQLLALYRTTNGVCSRLGVMAMSLAIVFWSLPLMGRPGLLRAIGTLGCLAGAMPMIALLSGYLPMNVHGVGAFVLVQAVWSLAIAVQLIRNRI